MTCAFIILQVKALLSASLSTNIVLISELVLKREFDFFLEFQRTYVIIMSGNEVYSWRVNYPETGKVSAHATVNACVFDMYALVRSTLFPRSILLSPSSRLVAIDWQVIFLTHSLAFLPPNIPHPQTCTGGKCRQKCNMQISTPFPPCVHVDWERSRKHEANNTLHFMIAFLVFVYISPLAIGLPSVDSTQLNCNFQLCARRFWLTIRA